METHIKAVTELIDRAEAFGKSTVELYRLKSIDKAADIISSLVVRIVVMTAFILFFIFLNIGIALWIGSATGENYIGFLIVACFYAIAGLVLYFFRARWIKTPVRNTIITQALN